jgi:hypothetical protein
MDSTAKHLILASEIVGLLHDLGKLRKEFAEETCLGGQVHWTRDDLKARTHINAAQGAILEDGRAYPPPGDDGWLQSLKGHPGWAAALRIPSEWLLPDTADRVQARGLGDPLREHHALKTLPDFTLGGDLFTFGADFRDSALDKSGNAHGSGQQRLGAAYLADAFGNELAERAYLSAGLDAAWSQAARVIQDILLKPDALQNLAATRARFLSAIRPLFEQALGATIRPTNDVTLWHHAYATASLHKALMAEGVLRRDFKPWQNEQGLMEPKRLGLIRFRLLGIRWDWAGLARTALEPIVFAGLAERRREAIAALRRRFEVDYPVGNGVYADDDGLVFVLPGFYEGEGDAARSHSEALFAEHVLDPLTTGVLGDLAHLGTGVEVRLAWTEPRLYLTDYHEVMPHQSQGHGRERVLQVDETGLRRLWSVTGDRRLALCPSCGVRPGQPAERGLGEARLESWRKGYCETCGTLSDQSNPAERFDRAAEVLGFRPRTFNLHKIRRDRNPDDNPRLALLSVQTDPLAIAEGAALATQIARPLCDLRTRHLPQGQRTVEGLSQFFQRILDHLQSGTAFMNPHQQAPEHARQLLGDQHWITEGDGRILEGTDLERARKLIDEFFLRERAPAALIRPQHTIADHLTLFALRKHASPGRLARTWSDLESVWRTMLNAIGGLTDGLAAPLSLDVRGFRVVVAAADLRAILGTIREQALGRFERVQGRFPLDLSVAVFREKFPLYLALDALRRMERRVAVLPPETWTLSATSTDGDRLLLQWETGRGHDAAWSVPLTAGDPQVRDLWYANVICRSRPPGPGRLVHMTELKPGDQVEVRPMTFDYAVLEGSARRYQLRYDTQGRRPHYVLGEPGRRPFLLEQMDDLFTLAGATGWTASQSKAIVGQVIDSYEHWVRDVPEPARASGRAAWLTHSERLLRKALPDDPATRDALLAGLDHGLFFDTFDWNEFVEKGARPATHSTPTGAPR